MCGTFESNPPYTVNTAKFDCLDLSGPPCTIPWDSFPISRYCLDMNGSTLSEPSHPANRFLTSTFDYKMGNGNGIQTTH